MILMGGLFPSSKCGICWMSHYVELSAFKASYDLLLAVIHSMKNIDEGLCIPQRYPVTLYSTVNYNNSKISLCI